jgi:hypothetical protein
MTRRFHGCPPSPDAWGRLNVVTPFHHLSGDSHINSSLREGPLRHLISCWHMNEHESAAMWKLYSSSNEAVCIRSTYRRLRRCLPQCVFVGEVSYIDYETGGFSLGKVFNAIMHKRLSFAHERELRAIFWEQDGTPDAQPYKPQIDDSGLAMEVDLPALIERVYVSPTAAPWFADLVRAMTKKYELAFPVDQSVLASAASW